MESPHSADADPDPDPDPDDASHSASNDGNTPMRLSPSAATETLASGTPPTVTLTPGRKYGPATSRVARSPTMRTRAPPAVVMENSPVGDRDDTGSAEALWRGNTSTSPKYGNTALMTCIANCSGAVRAYSGAPEPEDVGVHVTMQSVMPAALLLVP